MRHQCIYDEHKFIIDSLNSPNAYTTDSKKKREEPGAPLSLSRIYNLDHFFNEAVEHFLVGFQ